MSLKLAILLFLITEYIKVRRWNIPSWHIKFCEVRFTGLEDENGKIHTPTAR
jgi:hypothetical protein